MWQSYSWHINEQKYIKCCKRSMNKKYHNPLTCPISHGKGSMTQKVWSEIQVRKSTPRKQISSLISMYSLTQRKGILVTCKCYEAEICRCHPSNSFFRIQLSSQLFLEKPSCWKTLNCKSEVLKMLVRYSSS